MLNITFQTKRLLGGTDFEPAAEGIQPTVARITAHSPPEAKSELKFARGDQGHMIYPSGVHGTVLTKIAANFSNGSIRRAGTDGAFCRNSPIGPPPFGLCCLGRKPQIEAPR